MSELRIDTGEFYLDSKWTCRVVYSYNSTGSFNSSTATQTNLTPAKNTVGFTDERLAGMVVNSVKVHASHTGGMYGGKFQIDDVTPDSDGFVTLTNPSFSDNAINITFSWIADTDNSGSHSSDYPTYDGNSSQTVYKEHTSSSKITEVYIIVDYEPDYTPPDLIAYTDPNPVKGETYVKAVHMTELHTNVNRIRVARKLTGYSFGAIVALETYLSGWNDHVLEIRSAIDEMNIEHETWIVLAENYPRLDVLLQLRRVVQAVSGGSSTVSTDPNVLSDSSTGLVYELSVVDGDLTMTEIESSNSSQYGILTDTVTSTAYKFEVVDGDLIMSETNSSASSQFGVFTDTATSTAYKLEVVEGDLTMSEA